FPLCARTPIETDRTQGETLPGTVHSTPGLQQVVQPLDRGAPWTLACFGLTSPFRCERIQADAVSPRRPTARQLQRHVRQLTPPARDREAVDRKEAHEKAVSKPEISRRLSS